MAGRIPQAFIDELIARTDIVELIGGRVQLKKAGREWKACCPFHNEKTPSFWVSPDKQFYHCFGCGAHGTALGFLIEHDKLPFPDAVEELASRLGLEVPREDGGAPRARGRARTSTTCSRRSRSSTATACANRRARRQYLEGRGITAESCVKFAVGYAPDAWDAVLKRFGGIPERERALLEAGLVIERSGKGESGYYDRFRDRVMFPIRDARGRPIAFGGRIIDAGRAEVPQLARDAAVPQGPRAVRPLRSAAGAAQGRAAAGRRGLRGRRAPRAVGHRLRRSRRSARRRRPSTSTACSA